MLLGKLPQIIQYYHWRLAFVNMFSTHIHAFGTLGGIRILEIRLYVHHRKSKPIACGGEHVRLKLVGWGHLLMCCLTYTLCMWFTYVSLTLLHIVIWISWCVGPPFSGILWMNIACCIHLCGASLAISGMYRVSQVCLWFLWWLMIMPVTNCIDLHVYIRLDVI